MLNRKLVGAIVAIAVALGLVYWFALRKEDTASTTTAERGRDGHVRTGGPALAGDDGGSAASPRQSKFGRWHVDADPDGPLRLEGQVVGPDGKPIGAADVWLGSSPDRETSTGDDGAFAFDGVVGKSYTLSASQGELIGATTYKLTAGSDPVIIRLSEGARIAVTVVDDDKQPVAGVRVVASSSQREAMTGADGKALLQPVHPGWTMVEGHAAGYAFAQQVVTVGAGGATASLRLVMHKGVAVAGRVVDEAGAPVARAHVTANNPPWGAAGDDVETDAQGKFALPTLAKGIHTVTAVDGVHAQATSAAFVVADKPVDGIEVKMLAGGGVKGMVVDRDGKPVAFATVRFASSSGPRGGGPPRRGGGPGGFGASRTATTDRNGLFELHGLPRNRLSARAESGDVASKLVDIDLETTATATDVKLVLDVSGMIRGVVVDDAGQPVPEVAVHAVPDVFGGAGASELMLSGMSSTTSDGGGNFAITGLPDGAYRLWAQRGANASTYGEGTPAHAGDKDVRVVLPATGVLTAKLVIAGSSAPPQLASVMVGQQTPVPIDNGAVTIKDLAPGSYDVTFRGAEFAAFVSHGVEIKPSQTTDLGTITMPLGRTLTGTVVDTAQNPVGGATVKLGTMLFGPANPSADSSSPMDDMLGVRNTVTASDGSFTLTGVPVKQTNVIAEHPTAGRSVGLPVPAGTDNPPPMTLVVHGYGAISGKVTQAGQPVGNVQVADAQTGGGAQATFASTSSDGSFLMSQVPEGPQVLTVMQAQMMSVHGTSQQVNVVAGQTATVTIDIPVGTLTLNVTIAPQPGATVNAAQVFLFRGNLQFNNGLVLKDNLFQAGVEGIQIWPLQQPSFVNLLPMTYSVCGIPITGNILNPQFQQRIQESMELLKVYCQPVTMAAQPTVQTLTLSLPSMTPLPGGNSGSGS
jgi:hypothetical protein